MFDLIAQLAGQGVSQVQTKPENTAQNGGDAPDSAVFGDILTKASEKAAAKGAENTGKAAFNMASSVGVTASAENDLTDTELAAQLHEQMGLSVQLPEQAPEKVELPENTTETNIESENTETADVATKLPDLKNAPQANGLNEHASDRAHEVISALQNELPLPEEQGTLAGNDAAHAVSEDVSVTVNANGTDATGLADENNNQATDETASWEQPAAQQNAPQENGVQESGTVPAAAAKEMAYHPVFEAPRNSLGKTEGDYASRPNRPAISANNGQPVLQTGLLSQVKPQQAEPAAGTTPVAQPLPEQAAVQAQQSGQFEPVEITFAAGSVQPMNQLKDARPVSAKTVSADAAGEALGFDANFDTALSTQTDMSNDNGGMDLGGQAFEAVESLAVKTEGFAEASVENASLFKSLSAQPETVSLEAVGGTSVSGLSQSALAAGVKAPDTAIPVFTASAQGVADQVVEATQYGVQNGHKALVLKLNPDNLGEVRLHLSSNAQQAVSAKLIVSSVDAHDSLNNQISILKQSLESQGLQVGKISVVMAGSAEFGANAGNNDQQHASAGQDNAQNNAWTSMNQNQNQQGNFNQSAQQMFNQMMNNSSGGGLPYGGYGNASESQQQAANSVSTPQTDDAAWGTPHDNQTHANGRVSLLV